MHLYGIQCKILATLLFVFHLEVSARKNARKNSKHIFRNKKRKKLKNLKSFKIIKEKYCQVTEGLTSPPYNSNEQSSFVELVIVVDNGVYMEMNKNLDQVHEYCRNFTTIVNSLYTPLNIFVALVGVVVWTEKNEIEISRSANKTLKEFLKYRREVLIKDHQNDNAQLLTNVTFDNNVIGMATLAKICSFEFSGGIVHYENQNIIRVAVTMAHELGHNFGMNHDENLKNCLCSHEKCIMSNTRSYVSHTNWSDCSVKQLVSSVQQGLNLCLKNMPKHLFDPSTCGNGFLEAGEQCDCGLPTVCENKCCDPMTCMLRSNATCATGKCCDLDKCDFHEAGFECRSSAGECDLPEYCDGEGEFCPVNYFKRDTEVCGGGKAFCHRRSCKSRNDQCKVLWGTSGESSEQCYEINKKGVEFGNCGYNRSSHVYKKCAKEDILCGRLQCSSQSKQLQFGSYSLNFVSYNETTNLGEPKSCKVALIDLGLETVDPALAPDGSKCGEGKMCITQKCESIETLRRDGKVKDCQHNCNNNGVCNNMGHCHCDKGFAPPNCDSPGPGGSLDSGPASKPTGGFALIVDVFFLAVIPLISLSSFVVYCLKLNGIWFISQSQHDEYISALYHIDGQQQPIKSTSLNQVFPSNTCGAGHFKY